MTNVSSERRRSGLKAWSTRDLLVVAAIGVALGIAQIPLIYASLSILAAVGPLYNAVVGGLFIIPGLMVLYITRRPGAALINSVFVGLVLTPFTPFGWISLIGALIVGVACEVPFLVTRYRYFGLPMLIIAGAGAGILNVLAGYVFYGYFNLTLGVQLALIFGTAVNGAILGGLPAKLLSDALAKTGVLSGYAIDRERRGEV